MFFWELATLVDIMLLEHWIEMKSVMGASKALEELAKLMPDGSVKDVPLNELAVDKNAANEDMIAAATSRATGRVIRTDAELMMARSVWRVERTTLERKVPPRAELTIEGATA
jgi:cation transport ATPase